LLLFQSTGRLLPVTSLPATVRRSIGSGSALEDYVRAEPFDAEGEKQMTLSDREMRFVEVFQEHYRQLFGYVYTLVRNYTDAEDVVQQTSLVLWKKFDEYQPNRNFFTWACGAARREALMFLRHRRRYRTHFSEAFQLKLAATMAGIRPQVLNARAQALDDCVRSLPENQRELMLQCFGGIKSVAIVAQENGRSTHSIYSSLRNIRKKLIECIDRSVSGGAEK
jgi:RNA polymerase sigma-70 factor, ECF subfamily